MPHKFNLKSASKTVERKMNRALVFLFLFGCSLPEPQLAYCNDAAVIEWTCFDDAGPICCPEHKDANGP